MVWEHDQDISSQTMQNIDSQTIQDINSKTMQYIDSKIKQDIDIHTKLLNAETTSDTNDEDNYCHCCGVKTPKARLHYGGITCYPCRSFFRRATVSKKKKKCKKAGRCKVRTTAG